MTRPASNQIILPITFPTTMPPARKTERKQQYAIAAMQPIPVRLKILLLATIITKNELSRDILTKA